MRPIERLRGDYCHKCDTERSIECYDKYDRPINYNLLIDKHLNNPNFLEKLGNKQLGYFMCRKCKTIYCIDWRGGFPQPVRDFYYINEFLYNNYSKRKDE